jgi:hypothetical protein
VNSTHNSAIATNSRGSEGAPETARMAGRSAWNAVVVSFVLGAVLSLAFFPLAFSTVSNFDDEGFFVTSLRRFLDHGSLYNHTKSAYGPFYFTTAGLFYKLTGLDPTPSNARVISLLLVIAASALFGAAVWRVTRSLLFMGLCQVLTFVLFVRSLRTAALHPGLWSVLALAVLCYALCSYAVRPRPALLLVAGAAVGAALMSKVNVGLFAAVAVVVAFVVGNMQVPRAWRGVVGFGVVALPFVVMSQRLYRASTMEFALLVGLAVLTTTAALSADVVSLPPRALLYPLGGVAAVVVLSSLWPLASGTSPAALVRGVVIRPLRQVDVFEAPAIVPLSWIPIVLALAVAFVAVAYRDRILEMPRWWRNGLGRALLAAAAVWAIGLAVLPAGRTVGGWLPVVGALLALAFMSIADPSIRLALRFVVPLAVLQSLHAYPVAGEQRYWATVTIFVPVVIALWAGLKRLDVWRAAGRASRAIVVGAGVALFVVSIGSSPQTSWHDYLESRPLGLAGTRLIRTNPVTASTLQKLTNIVRKNCDTFYSAPGFDSLYVYTRLPTPTGLLSNTPGALTTSEQREVASQLAALQAGGKRVCIVSDSMRISQWLSSYGDGPLGRAVGSYQHEVGRSGPYTVSVHGVPGGEQP